MGAKYSDIRRKLNLPELNGTPNGSAYLTHYWQGNNDRIRGYFKDEALEYLETIVEDPAFNYELPLEYDVPFPPPQRPSFTFIDLFAGIGGFRIAFQEMNGKCVFSSEWDRHSQKTYEANFGEIPFGDITKIDEKKIPEHDILCAGFPCQPFSIAGVSKKNSLGRKHGFEDETQGTLFFDIKRIIKARKPRAFLLENVKNLRGHDKGRTFEVIERNLKDLGYMVFSQVLDAKYYVPQHRERIFIVGFSKEHFPESLVYEFPEPPAEQPQFRDILERSPDEKYTLSDHLWNYLQEYAAKHKAKGNGFGFGLTDLNGVARTLSARYHKDGSEILIPQRGGKNPRRLTPEECKHLMGYPDRFRIHDTGVSDTQLYRQFGNSVVVPVVQAVAANMLDVFRQYKRQEERRKQREAVLNGRASASEKVSARASE
ncbi:MAG: DNA (cytosine-5-)-methyltransferase [Flavobacteriales bacterium]|nr:DNA (cytosine-5-)-methyltransferase [Flavobacteriales bacterium]